MEAQIVKIGDKKWGSKVSQKLFVDRAFVVKHVRNKHTHLLDAEREQVRASHCLLSCSRVPDDPRQTLSRSAERQCWCTCALSRHHTITRPRTAPGQHLFCNRRRWTFAFRGLQYQDELFFEAFKAARDEEERAAKQAAEAARRVRRVLPSLPDTTCRSRPIPTVVTLHSRTHGSSRMHRACWPLCRYGYLQAGLGGGQDGQWDAANQNGFAPELPAPFVGGGPGAMGPGGGVGGVGGMGGMSVPAGMVLVPAPGAGPFGPFIPVPMDQVCP